MSNKPVVSSLVLAALMVASAGAAKLITPTHYLANERPALSLAHTIPTAFGDWREEKAQVSAVVNPSVEAALKAIYSQTLSRTYVNGAGYRIMLSLAYGSDQSDGLQLHYPEVCYPAQGFEVTAKRDSLLALPQGNIATKQLETNLSRERFEPITYWSTIGDVVVAGGVDKKLAEMRYRLKGRIPDGLLFRVSSIDTDTARSFAMHGEFIKALAQVLPAAEQRRLMGLNN